MSHLVPKTSFGSSLNLNPSSETHGSVSMDVPAVTDSGFVVSPFFRPPLPASKEERARDLVAKIGLTLKRNDFDSALAVCRA